MKKMYKWKGQTSVIVLVFGLIVISTLLISLSVIGSQSVRNSNYIQSKQLDKLTEGGAYHAISKLQNEIDYAKNPLIDNTLSFPDMNKHAYNEIEVNGSTASIKTEIAIKDDGSTEDTEVVERITGIGDFEDTFTINQADDACFYITWDKDTNTNQYATVKFELFKVRADGTDGLIKLPVVENDGVIGVQPITLADDDCSQHTSSPSLLSKDDIYKDNAVVQGYGKYKIKVTTMGSNNAVNLQTSGLYNILTYRTFEVKTTAKYRNLTKKSTIILEARYETPSDNNYDNLDIKPQFEYKKWLEGDE